MIPFILYQINKLRSHFLGGKRYNLTLFCLILLPFFVNCVMIAVLLYMIASKAIESMRKEQEPEGLKNAIQIRLYPTRAQAHMLDEHCQEYIDCVNTIVSAHNADTIPDGFRTKPEPPSFMAGRSQP